MNSTDFPQADTKATLSAPAAAHHAEGSDGQRRLAWILCAGIAGAVLFEIAGRALYSALEAPYIVTGSMTLAAVVTWGGVSIFSVRRLQSSLFVKRLVMWGALALIFSQVVSLLADLDIAILRTAVYDRPVLYFVLEEGMFLVGISSLFLGFYASIFETHRAHIQTEYRRQLLAIEVEERRKAQERLKESEQTLRTLIAVNPESLLLVDADYRILVANDTTALRFNTTLEELPGRDISLFFPPELAGFARTPFETATETGTVCRFEAERSGHYYDCYVCPVKGADGKVQRYALMEIDITGRKQMEDALRSLNQSLEQRVQERTQELQQTNQRLLDAMNLNEELITVSPLGILAFKASGACVVANAAASRILELSPKELLSLDFRDSGRLRRLGLHALLESVLTSETHLHGEVRAPRTAGEDLHVDYYISSFVSAEDRHLLLLLNDVTERVRSRAIIEEQRREIDNAARMSELGMLSSGIAHEIKTPLAVISAGAQQLQQLLKQPSHDQAKTDKALNIILRNVQRITDIIKSLQNLTRESARDPFSRVSAARIVGDAVDLCRHRFLKSGTLLRVSGAEGVYLECRPAQISQVLINLLNNAHDAVESLKDRWVRVEVEERDGEVVFSVTDSGKDLSVEIMEKLFQPFFTTKKEGKGIGIGLSVSKRIIDTHSGRFEIDASSANTRFLVRLPASQALPQ